MKEKKVKAVYCHQAPQLLGTGIVSNTIEAEKHGCDIEFYPTGCAVLHKKSGRKFFIYSSIILDVEFMPDAK